MMVLDTNNYVNDLSVQNRALQIAALSTLNWTTTID